MLTFVDMDARVACRSCFWLSNSWDVSMVRKLSKRF
jgi:hypothetical protein